MLPIKEILKKQPYSTMQQLNFIMMSQFSLQEHQANLPISDITQVPFSTIQGNNTQKKWIQRQTHIPTGTAQLYLSNKIQDNISLTKTEQQIYQNKFSGNLIPKHLSIQMLGDQDQKIIAQKFSSFKICQSNTQIDLMVSNVDKNKYNLNLLKTGKKLQKTDSTQINDTDTPRFITAEDKVFISAQIAKQLKQNELKKTESNQLTETPRFISTDNQYFTSKKIQKQLQQNKKNSEKNSNKTGSTSFISTDNQYLMSKKPAKFLSQSQLKQKAQSQQRLKKVINKFCQSQVVLNQIVQTSQESQFTNNKSTQILNDDSFVYMGGKLIKSKSIPQKDKFIKTSQNILESKKEMNSSILQTQQNFVQNNDCLLTTKIKNYL